MAKKFQLSVTEPCRQEWDSMILSDGGRFCNSCQKVVVDFSTMTDQELITYFQKSMGAVCGRFERTQLDRDMMVPKRGLPWVRYFFQFTLPAFLLSLKVSAQKDIIGKRTPTCVVLAADVKATTNSSKEPKKTLSGKIVNAQGQPIPFATVKVKAKNEGVVADATGAFTLSHRYTDSITLEISSVGYTVTEHVVKDINLPQEVTAVLEQALSRTLGEVVVTGYAIRKPKRRITLFTSEKRDTAFSRFSVYPNPVRSHGNITIESKKLEKGEYTVQLVGLDGRIVCAKTMILDSKGGLLRMDLPTLISGQYLISVMHLHSNKTYTEKITVL